MPRNTASQTSSEITYKENPRIEPQYRPTWPFAIRDRYGVW